MKAQGPIIQSKQPHIRTNNINKKKTKTQDNVDTRENKGLLLKIPFSETLIYSCHCQCLSLPGIFLHPVPHNLE